MEECENESQSTNIPELVRRQKCDTKTCNNYDHSCLVLPGQKHFTLSANDFCIWDKAIQSGKATFDAPPLSVRGSPVASQKSQIAITNNNASTFPSGTYPYYPMPAYHHYPSSSSSYPPPPHSYTTAASSVPAKSLTPARQHVAAIFSSPIDMSSARNNDVSGYMNWMIAGVKNNPHEVDALLKAKAKLEETMPDLEVIQGMTNAEYDSIDIP